MLAIVHTAINWEAVGVITATVLTVVGGVGKAIASKTAQLDKKLDLIGEHLERQDEAKAKLAERVAHIEGVLTFRSRQPRKSVTS